MPDNPGRVIDQRAGLEGEILVWYVLDQSSEVRNIQIEAVYDFVNHGPILPRMKETATKGGTGGRLIPRAIAIRVMALELADYALIK